MLSKAIKHLRTDSKDIKDGSAEPDGNPSSQKKTDTVPPKDAQSGLGTPVLGRGSERPIAVNASLSVKPEGGPRRGHRRVQSAATPQNVVDESSSARNTPMLSRTPVDDEVDPFKKRGKKGVASQRGSFRNFFSSEEPGAAAGGAGGGGGGGAGVDDAAAALTGKKKNVINKLLSRARAGSRERLPARTDLDSSYLDDDQSDEGGDSRQLERTDSVVIHEERPALRHTSDGVTDSPSMGRNKHSGNYYNHGGEEKERGKPKQESALDEDLPVRRSRGVVVSAKTPSNVLKDIEGALTKIHATFEESADPIVNLKSSKIRCEQLHDVATDNLTNLTRALQQALANSNLSEYEFVAEELAQDPLYEKFRFGPDNLIEMDRHLARLEDMVRRTLGTSSKSSVYIFYAATALVIGAALAYFI